MGGEGDAWEVRVVHGRGGDTEVTCRRYEQEVERGRELNNRLATGISLFVALSGLSFDGSFPSVAC